MKYANRDIFNLSHYLHEDADISVLGLALDHGLYKYANCSHKKLQICTAHHYLTLSRKKSMLYQNLGNTREYEFSVHDLSKT